MVNCKLLLGVLLLWGVVACETAVSPTPIVNQLPPLQPTPTLQVTPSPAMPASPIPSPPPDSGWELLHSGLERRTIRLLDENGRQTEQLYLLRIEPTLYDFDIAYSPGQPKLLTTWQQETGALVVVNGGFFTPEFVATGLVVVDGQPSGSSYTGFGGMVAILDGGVEVRSLQERPYSPNEPLQAALQAFPMLLLNGEAAYQKEDNDPARRTVVGVDENGRILLILASWGSFTLAEFSNYLETADFGLVTALNLDGGTSSGLILADPTESVPAFISVPNVITISPKL
ncbi:MAG: phosphodiester glycosidase family protein [Chloroflexi bacterium]|nr:phosphodiester glycosidase family protein [Chloroflexota bacterium]